MAKLMHIRVDDSVYEALSSYNDSSNTTMQDAISNAIMQFLTREMREAVPDTAAFTFIDLFAGIGGMRIAFEKAGGHCVYSNEWDKYCQQTYFANFGEQPEGDITKVDAKDIPDHDILVAGFPCQPFSIAGVSKKNSMGRATGFEDKTQGTLFFDVARIIKEKRPKVFMLENVKNLKSHDKGNTFRVIRETLEELDYEVFYEVLDGQNFVPQHRERIVIVGFDRKRYEPLIAVSKEEMEEGNPFRNAKLRDKIDFRFDITPVEPKPVMKDILIPDDVLREESGDKYTLSDKLWSYLQNYAVKHKAAGNGFGYGIAPRDGISRTLSARYYKDGSEILIEQPGRNPRRLTPRECARLQGFPDDFKITVSDTRAYKQFGNSVVVPLMTNVAQLVTEKMKELDGSIREKEEEKTTVFMNEPTVERAAM